MKEVEDGVNVTVPELFWNEPKKVDVAPSKRSPEVLVKVPLARVKGPLSVMTAPDESPVNVPAD